jgi:hypothetical protein
LSSKTNETFTSPSIRAAKARGGYFHPVKRLRGLEHDAMEYVLVEIVNISSRIENMAVRNESGRIELTGENRTEGNYDL